jgi:hypothetical protein
MPGPTHPEKKNPDGQTLVTFPDGTDVQIDFPPGRVSEFALAVKKDPSIVKPTIMGIPPSQRSEFCVKVTGMIANSTNLTRDEIVERQRHILSCYLHDPNFGMGAPTQMLQALELVGGTEILAFKRFQDPSQCNTSLELVAKTLGLTLGQLYNVRSQQWTSDLRDHLTSDIDYKLDPETGIPIVSLNTIMQIARMKGTAECNLLFATMQKAFALLHNLRDDAQTRKTHRGDAESGNLGEWRCLNILQPLIETMSDHVENDRGSTSSLFFVSVEKMYLRTLFGMSRESLEHAMGVCGSVRDAIANDSFIALSTAFRVTMKARMQNALQDPDALTVDGKISLKALRELKEVLNEDAKQSVRAWATNVDRIRGLLNAVPLDIRKSKRRRTRGMDEEVFDPLKINFRSNLGASTSAAGSSTA